MRFSPSFLMIFLMAPAMMDAAKLLYKQIPFVEALREVNSNRPREPKQNHLIFGPEATDNANDDFRVDEMMVKVQMPTKVEDRDLIDILTKKDRDSSAEATVEKTGESPSKKGDKADKGELTSNKNSVSEQFFNSVASAAGLQVGTNLASGLLGRPPVQPIVQPAIVQPLLQSQPVVVHQNFDGNDDHDDDEDHDDGDDDEDNGKGSKPGKKPHHHHSRPKYPGYPGYPGAQPNPYIALGIPAYNPYAAHYPYNANTGYQVANPGLITPGQTFASSPSVYSTGSVYPGGSVYPSSGSSFPATGSFYSSGSVYPGGSVYSSSGSTFPSSGSIYSPGFSSSPANSFYQPVSYAPSFQPSFQGGSGYVPFGYTPAGSGFASLRAAEADPKEKDKGNKVDTGKVVLALGTGYLLYNAIKQQQQQQQFAQGGFNPQGPTSYFPAQNAGYFPPSGPTFTQQSPIYTQPSSSFPSSTYNPYNSYNAFGGNNYNGGGNYNGYGAGAIYGKEEPENPVLIHVPYFVEQPATNFEGDQEEKQRKMSKRNAEEESSSKPHSVRITLHPIEEGNLSTEGLSLTPTESRKEKKPPTAAYVLGGLATLALVNSAINAGKRPQYPQYQQPSYPHQQYQPQYINQYQYGQLQPQFSQYQPAYSPPLVSSYYPSPSTTTYYSTSAPHSIFGRSQENSLALDYGAEKGLPLGPLPLVPILFY